MPIILSDPQYCRAAAIAFRNTRPLISPVGFETVLAGTTALQTDTVIAQLAQANRSLSLCDMATPGLLGLFFMQRAQAAYLQASLVVTGPVALQRLGMAVLTPEQQRRPEGAKAVVSGIARVFKTACVLALMPYNAAKSCFYLGFITDKTPQVQAIYQPDNTGYSQEKAVIASATLLYYYTRRATEDPRF